MKKLASVILAAVFALGLAACQTTSFNTDRNISVVTREDGSGTKSAFMEIVGLKGKADPANIIIQGSTAAVLAEVKSNPSAIAYDSLGYITDEVKMLTVDGVAATVENIRDGSYRISRPLSVVYQEGNLDDELNAAFFAFLQSSQAQEIINDMGYVSVVEDAEEYVINGSLRGTIDISGSTSVQPLMIELAALFENLQPNVDVMVSGGGSGTGYNNAQGGVSVFGMISENFVIDKAPDCVFLEIAKDGIAIIVNNANPLNNITMEQINMLYDVDNSELVRWSDIIR